MTLERLKELNTRLEDLLKDPQPGLMSWCISLNTVMTALITEWKGEIRS